MKNILRLSAIAFCVIFSPTLAMAATGTTFFTENFDDSNFSSRGWYDGTYSAASVTTNSYSGAGAYQCEFARGATHCNGGDPRRMAFTASDSVYVSYYMLLSSNWIGSGVAYHPHIINILTNQNGAYDGLAQTHMNGYMELNANKLRLAVQDAQNIDTSNINVNLCSTSENRANFGCNGQCNSDTWDYIECYFGGNGTYSNSANITPNVPLSLNTWHHIEGYFQMNTVSGGKGNNNGIMRAWIDGIQVLNYTDIIYRTNQYPTMQFNKFVIAPYMAPTSGTGSPVDQYFLMDNLVVASSPPGGVVPPSAPSNLTVK